MTSEGALHPANPWSALGDESPFVHPSDRPVVDAFRAFVPDDAHPSSLRLERLPEPCFGPLHPRVLLLLLNPGHDGTEPRLASGDPAVAVFRDRMRGHDIPHTHLGANVGDTAGARWWRASIGPLQRQSALSEDAIAARLGVVQYLPYASPSFGHAHLRLPTQDYARWRVEQALASGAVLVVRGLRYWLGLMPELHPLLATGRVMPFANPRTVSLSPGSLGGQSNFFRILERISA